MYVISNCGNIDLLTKEEQKAVSAICDAYQELRDKGKPAGEHKTEDIHYLFCRTLDRLYDFDQNMRGRKYVAAREILDDLRYNISAESNPTSYRLLRQSLERWVCQV